MAKQKRRNQPAYRKYFEYAQAEGGRFAQEADRAVGCIITISSPIAPSHERL